MTHCLQRPGEVMIVPTAWWHATCNLAEFTLGIGGQDSCDLIDCTPPGPEGESQQEYHMRMQVITCMCIVPHAYAGHPLPHALPSPWLARPLLRSYSGDLLRSYSGF